MNSYTPFVWPPTPQSLINDVRMTDLMNARGTNRTPAPPRDVLTSSGDLKILVNWREPDATASKKVPVTGYKVYADTESNLVQKINDP